MKSIFFLFVFTSFSFLAQAQSPTIEYKELLTATVTQNASQLLSPFCGGINSTQPNHADLNNDGKDDITIFDENTRTLKTFINVGNPGEAKYQYDPKYAANFPYINYYLKLIDYNCDNVPDLIHKGSGGFSVYKGKYINNELHFTYYQDLYYPGFFGKINAYVQPNDIPIVADIDCDGDLDFASYDVLGSYCPWYKNLQVEDSLPCDSIRIVLGDPCYGKMYQTFIREHILNASCKGGVNGTSNKKQRHSGNCILSIDINGDGLQDMLGGNISFSDAQLLYNGGTCNAPKFTSQDTLFDADNHQLKLHTWPAPFYFDIDNDNDKDLVFTPHNDNTNSANYNAMAVYENIGTTAVPNFKWTNDSAFVDQLIDVGRNSHPTLFDYDKDGKKDLFIGGEGYFNTISETRKSNISYYRNTSTVVGQVSFEFVTDDFLNLESKNYAGIYPAFGDVTGDGIDDLVFGNDSGTIVVYQNTASSNTTMPSFNWLTDNLANINVGSHSFPVVYDFNNDSKTDLLIGCQLGSLWLFQDTSLTATKEYKRIDSAVNNIKTGSNFSFFSYGVPFIGPVDSSGKDYLLVGTVDGNIERYDSFTNGNLNWIREDSMMALLQTAYRAAPAIADLDGDQRPELLIGNQNGGLRLFQFVKNLKEQPDAVRNYSAGVAIQVFPNPAKNELWIKASSQFDKIESYSIRDITGRIIAKDNKKKNIEQSINVAYLKEGIYFIEIQFDKKNIAISKFILTD